ncbi:MAG: helix-turn-helix domain-containing protein [Gammaproteobacteria bacterium]|nr:helix-turn-helix domain-containing protein [Gammaproteobacteria bacterium]
MKVHHDLENDYLSIDFADEVEAKSVYQDGIIVRYDNSGNVIGIDITDSMKLFSSSDLMTLQEVCEFLGVSESTIRRKIRSNKIRYTKEGNQYRFRKADVLTFVA